MEKIECDFSLSFLVVSSTSRGLGFDHLLVQVGIVVGEERLGGFAVGTSMSPCDHASNSLQPLHLSRTNAKGHLDYDRKSTVNGERRQSIFGRKILRRLYGQTCEEGQWRKRYSRDIEEL